VGGRWYGQLGVAFSGGEGLRGAGRKATLRC